MPFSTDVSPFNAPNYDIFRPARRHDDRGVVLGSPLDGAQNYSPWIGLTTVRELALEFQPVVGLVPKEDLDGAWELILGLKNKVLELEARNAELEANQERIAGLARAGFKVQKIQGRPPKREEN